MKRFIVAGLSMLAVLLALGNDQSFLAANQSNGKANEIPIFEYDPSWPKQLPNGWITGNIGAMTIGPNDHIWIVQRPNSTTGLSERYGLAGESECCWPAPPVIEFDASGNLIQA